MTAKKLHWQPGIVIGLGGTGVRTLRYLKWHIAADGDGDLAALYRSGGLRLLGIDTHTNEASETLSVGPAMRVREDGTGQGVREVPPLADEFVPIPTEAILNGLKELRDTYFGDGADKRRQATIAAWFPRSDSDSGMTVTLGQALEGGAGQWRVLGRLAFFQQAGAIHTKLKGMLDDIKKRRPGKRPLVQIVGSLAGGTGSGMFWDAAIMARMVAPDARIVGNFLLPEVFAAFTEQPNADANTYAALKEIAVYKNLMQTDTLRVDYPIADGDNVFQGTPGGVPIFDTVFLYEGFRIIGNPEDRAKQVLGTTNYRTAENLLARMRAEVDAELNKVTQNARGDSNAMNRRQGGLNAFSTSSTVSATIRDLGEESTRFAVRLLHRLKTTRLSPDGGWPVLEAARLDRDFLTIDDRGDAKASAQAAVVSMIGNWANRLADGPTRLSAGIDGAEKGLEQQKSIAERAVRKWNPTAVADEVWKVYKHSVGDRVRDEWSHSFLQSLFFENTPKEGRQRRARAVLGTHGDLYRNDLDRLFTGFQGAAKKMRESLVNRGEALADPLQSTLKALIGVLGQLPIINDADSFMEALSILCVGEGSVDEATGPLRDLAGRIKESRDAAVRAEGDPAQQPEEGLHIRLWKPLEIRPHPAFYGARITLGVYDPNDETDKRAKADHDKRGAVGPVHLALRHLLKTLKTDWHALAEEHRKLARDARLVAALDYIARRKTDIISDINALLTADDALRRRLSNYSERVSARIDVLGPKELGIDAGHHVEDTLEPVRKVVQAMPKPFGNEGKYRACAERLLREIHDAGRDQSASLGKLPLFGTTSRLREEATEWIKGLLQRARDHGNGAPPPSGFGAQGADEPYPAFAWAAGIVDGLLKLDHPEVGSNPEAFDLYAAGLVAAANGFMAYWLTEADVIRETVGNQAHVNRLLELCRVEVFAVGRELPTIQRNHIVVVPPQFGEGGKARDELTEHFKTQYTISAGRVWSAAKVAVTAPSHRYPIIYYEGLFRTGREINRIQNYLAAYQRHGKDDRRFFHLFPGADALPELAERFAPKRFIRCGNPTCSHDISTQPRTDIHCGGCGNPIQNRCGNDTCSDVDLRARIAALGPLSPEAGRDGIPFNCPNPDCGKPLKTYWWRCDQGHPDHIAQSLSNCPDCMAEHRSGRRRLAEVARNPDRKRILCPGCLKLGLGPSEAFVVSGELLPYFEDGVSPVKRDQFLALTDRLRLNRHLCPNQRRQSHYLFPTCHNGAGQPAQRHHLHRGEPRFAGSRQLPGPFRCSEHPELIDYWECYHCSYPVPKRNGSPPGACPRCLHKLELCHYCSAATGRVYEGVRSPSGGQSRCPNCFNLMRPPSVVSDDIVRRDLEYPSFCRNMFGCVAAADPWNTAADVEKNQHCLACHTGEPPPLLPLADLKSHIERCPFCLMFLGLPKEGKVHMLERRELLYHVTRPGFRLTADRCVICTTSAVSVMKWLHDDVKQSKDPARVAWLRSGNQVLDYYGNAFPDSAVQQADTVVDALVKGNHFSPDVEVDVGIELLGELVGNPVSDQRLATRFAAKERDLSRGGRVDVVQAMERLQGFFEPERTAIHTLQTRWRGIEEALLKHREDENFRPQADRSEYEFMF